MTPTILVSTWGDGVFALTGDARAHELAGEVVRGLVPDGRGGALAIVGEHTLRRRAADGAWHTLASSDASLACCVAAGDVIYLGTDDARVLRFGGDGALQALEAFATVPGRETWYAGQAVVDGRVVGPPLGVRSITVSADGKALLVNVHVGGIPRSTDGGRTWLPTIDVESDVHEVRAHPSRPEIVAAASAAGLCLSRDGGASWAIHRDGLHAPHCTAVAFVGDDVLIAASVEQFSPHGAVYRAPIDGAGALTRPGGGLPEWLDGIADTGCMASNGSAAAIADGGGNVLLSGDAGRSWSLLATGLAGGSGVLVV